MCETYEYKNSNNASGYGPPTYTTDKKPHKYKGFLLFNRLPGTVCDIVRDGVCVSQCVTVQGAKRYIDKVLLP